MKITVTPVCRHPDGYIDHGPAITGRGVVINRDGVWLDGQAVIQRDRRAIKAREKGHPWLVTESHSSPGTRVLRGAWTGFRVEVEP